MKKENYCPLIKKSCIKHECSWYIQVRGYDNNTGKEVDEYACAIAWMPALLIENSNQQRSTGAAVESFRNEMVEANQNSLKVLAVAAQQNQNRLLK